MSNSCQIKSSPCTKTCYCFGEEKEEENAIAEFLHQMSQQQAVEILINEKDRNGFLRCVFFLL